MWPCMLVMSLNHRLSRLDVRAQKAALPFAVLSRVTIRPLVNALTVVYNLWHSAVRRSPRLWERCSQLGHQDDRAWANCRCKSTITRPLRRLSGAALLLALALLALPTHADPGPGAISLHTSGPGKSTTTEAPPPPPEDDTAQTWGAALLALCAAVAGWDLLRRTRRTGGSR